MGITSNISDDGIELHIRIDGRFDFSDHSSFRETYSKLNARKVSFNIDMSRTEYIDSAALGMLLLLRERAGGDSARIRIQGCQQDVMRVLEVSRFNQLFDIGSGESALSANG